MTIVVSGTCLDLLLCLTDYLSSLLDALPKERLETSQGLGWALKGAGDREFGVADGDGNAGE